jgi:hypothetical protein
MAAPRKAASMLIPLCLLVGGTVVLIATKDQPHKVKTAQPQVSDGRTPVLDASPAVTIAAKGAIVSALNRMQRGDYSKPVAFQQNALAPFHLYVGTELRNVVTHHYIMLTRIRSVTLTSCFTSGASVIAAAALTAGKKQSALATFVLKQSGRSYELFYIYDFDDGAKDPFRIYGSEDGRLRQPLGRRGPVKNGSDHF